MAKLTLDIDAAISSGLNNAARQRSVAVKIKRGSVDHNACAAETQRTVCFQFRRAVIQMIADRNLGTVCCRKHHGRNKKGGILLKKTAVALDDDRRMHPLCGIDDAHHGFHVIDIEGGYCVAAFLRIIQNFFQINKHRFISPFWHVFHCKQERLIAATRRSAAMSLLLRAESCFYPIRQAW